VPKHVIEKHPKELDESPGTLVANGPYVLKEWRPHDHITLVKNARYLRRPRNVKDRYRQLSADPTMLPAAVKAVPQRRDRFSNMDFPPPRRRAVEADFCRKDRLADVDEFIASPYPRS